MECDDRCSNNRSPLTEVDKQEALRVAMENKENIMHEQQDDDDDEVFFGEVTDKEKRKADKFSKRRTIVFQPGFRNDRKLMRYTMDPARLAALSEEGSIPESSNGGEVSGSLGENIESDKENGCGAQNDIENQKKYLDENVKVNVDLDDQRDRRSEHSGSCEDGLEVNRNSNDFNSWTNGVEKNGKGSDIDKTDIEVKETDGNNSVDMFADDLEGNCNNSHSQECIERTGNLDNCPFEYENGNDLKECANEPELNGNNSNSVCLDTSGDLFGSMNESNGLEDESSVKESAVNEPTDKRTDNAVKDLIDMVPKLDLSCEESHVVEVDSLAQNNLKNVNICSSEKNRPAEDCCIDDKNAVAESSPWSEATEINTDSTCTNEVSSTLPSCETTEVGELKQQQDACDRHLEGEVQNSAKSQEAETIASLENGAENGQSSFQPKALNPVKVGFKRSSTSAFQVTPRKIDMTTSMPNLTFGNINDEFSNCNNSEPLSPSMTFTVTNFSPTLKVKDIKRPNTLFIKPAPVFENSQLSFDMHEKAICAQDEGLGGETLLKPFTLGENEEQYSDSGLPSTPIGFPRFARSSWSDSVVRTMPELITEEPFPKLDFDIDNDPGSRTPESDMEAILAKKKLQLEQLRVEKQKIQQRLAMKQAMGSRQDLSLEPRSAKWPCPMPTASTLPRVRYKDTQALSLASKELEAVTQLHTLTNSHRSVKVIKKPRSANTKHFTVVAREARRLQWLDTVVTPVTLKHMPSRRAMSATKPILHERPTDYTYPYHEEQPAIVVVSKSRRSSTGGIHTKPTPLVDELETGLKKGAEK